MIFVLGTKEETIEDICSAISLSFLINKQKMRAEPVVFKKLKKEVVYLLKKYNVEKPKKVDNLKNKKVILVNHNFLSKFSESVEKAKIFGVIDTHEISFKHENIITFITKPYKSTCTLIFELFEEEDIFIPKKIRSLLLCGILYSTKGLTDCTKNDYKAAESLSNSLLLNLNNFAKEFMKNLKMDKNIFEMFFENLKEENINNKRIGIVILKSIDGSLIEKKQEILHEMSKLRKEGFHSVLTLITDLTNKKTFALILSENKDVIASLLNKKIKNNVIVFERELKYEDLLSSLKEYF